MYNKQIRYLMRRIITRLIVRGGRYLPVTETSSSIRVEDLINLCTKVFLINRRRGRIFWQDGSALNSYTWIAVELFVMLGRNCVNGFNVRGHFWIHQDTVVSKRRVIDWNAWMCFIWDALAQPGICNAWA